MPRENIATPFRHRISLWLGLFVTCFLVWASWHSQYLCPRLHLPLGHTKGNPGTGRAITAFREDRQTLLIYGHQNLSQLLHFSIQPKRTVSARNLTRTGTTLQGLLITSQRSGFRTLLIRDSHLLTAWFILWIGGLTWQHFRLKRHLSRSATAPPARPEPQP